MRVVSQIDRAIKKLYNIETSLCAENFLIDSFPDKSIRKVSSKNIEGALYIKQNSPKMDSEDTSIDLGIYFSPGVYEELRNFPRWNHPWTLSQLQAFSVVCEEVSHFHYLIFNLSRQRPVSEFELELQGEIDRFILMFFCEDGIEKNGTRKFDELFEQLFFNYRLASFLTDTQTQRYKDASIYAKRFFQKMKSSFSEREKFSDMLKQARLFYGYDLADKVSFLLGTRL